MKKIIYLLTTIAISATLMMGCGSTSTSTTSTGSSDTSQSTSTDNSSNKPDDMQQADLEGEVTSVSGNKITLKLIKSESKPADDNNTQPADSNGSSTSTTSNTTTNSSSSTTSSDTTNKDAQGTHPQRQIEYTGETKEITLSDSVKITTMSKGQQDSSSTTLSASDIKVGNILQITYSDDSNETISSIMVMPTDTQSNTTSSSTTSSSTTTK